MPRKTTVISQTVWFSIIAKETPAALSAKTAAKAFFFCFGVFAQPRHTKPGAKNLFSAQRPCVILLPAQPSDNQLLCCFLAGYCVPAVKMPPNASAGNLSQILPADKPNAARHFHHRQFHVNQTLLNHSNRTQLGIIFIPQLLIFTQTGRFINLQAHQIIISFGRLQIIFAILVNIKPGKQILFFCFSICGKLITSASFRPFLSFLERSA